MIQWIPTPPELAQAPELAMLAALRVQLELTRYSLVAAHPDITADARPVVLDAVARRAWHLIRQTYRLQLRIDRYWRAARPPPRASDLVDDDDLF